MDLPRACDTLNHNLIAEKLKAYCLNLNVASFIKSGLTIRHQSCKIGDSFSKWERIIAGVPQGSILGPLLLSIFINDIFLYNENLDLYNYADDSTLYASGEFLSIIIANLKADFLRISRWFHEDFLILNPDKCTFSFTCNGTTIESSKEEKVLGVKIDITIRHNVTLGIYD